MVGIFTVPIWADIDVVVRRAYGIEWSQELYEKLSICFDTVYRWEIAERNERYRERKK